MARHKILYATDFSKASARAFDEALKLARQNSAQLIVAHVIEPTPYPTGEEFGGPELYVRLEEIARKQAAGSMEKLMRRVKKTGVRAQSLMLKGLAYDQIVKAAKKAKADMIVIGTHGRTGLSKLFMGSVAGKVISLATCPVVTVRGK